jgi:hypothetical protein
MRHHCQEQQKKNSQELRSNMERITELNQKGAAAANKDLTRR